MSEIRISRFPPEEYRRIGHSGTDTYVESRTKEYSECTGVVVAGIESEWKHPVQRQSDCVCPLYPFLRYNSATDASRWVEEVR